MNFNLYYFFTCVNFLFSLFFSFCTSKFSTKKDFFVNYFSLFITTISVSVIVRVPIIGFIAKILFTELNSRTLTLTLTLTLTQYDMALQTKVETFYQLCRPMTKFFFKKMD